MCGSGSIGFSQMFVVCGLTSWYVCAPLQFVWPAVSSRIGAEIVNRVMGKSKCRKAMSSHGMKSGTQKKTIKVKFSQGTKSTTSKKAMKDGTKKAMRAVAAQKAMKVKKVKQDADVVVAENVHLTQRERFVFAACLALCNEGRLFEGMSLPVKN